MSTEKIQITQNQNQDLISQVFWLLTQNERLRKWKLKLEKNDNAIILQWVSRVSPENAVIRVVFHGDAVEVTFIQARNEYKITVDFTKKPLWLEPDFMAYVIAEIVDLMARVYFVDF